MKKKGFTLIELLAVLVVMAIIAFIVTPIVLNMIETTKKEAFQRDVEMAIDAADLYVAQEGFKKLPEEGMAVTELAMKQNKFIYGIIKNGENEQLKVEGVGDGTYCASGTKSKLQVIKGDCSKLDMTEPKNVRILDCQHFFEQIKCVVIYIA